MKTLCNSFALVLLTLSGAEACVPHFVEGDLSNHDASATASGIRLTLDGNVYGWPDGPHSACDQLATVGPDGVVRGIGTNVSLGWNIGTLGTVGERIGLDTTTTPRKQRSQAHLRLLCKTTRQSAPTATLSPSTLRAITNRVRSGAPTTK